MGYLYLTPLTVAALFFGLWLLVMVKGQKTTLNLTYCVFILTMTVWAVAIGMFYYVHTPVMERVWTNTIYISGTMMPASFLLFSYIFPSGQFTIPRWKRALIFVPNVLLAPLYLFTDWMVTGTGYAGTIKTAFYGPGQILWNLHFVPLFLFALFRFHVLYRRYTGIVKHRLKFIIMGTWSGLILGGTTNVIMPFLGMWHGVWLGPPLVLTWLACIAYAIFRYQLMDIQIFIKKSVVYSVLIAFTTFFYMSSALIFERLFQHVVGYQSTIFSIATIFVIALLINPVKNRVQDFVDRTFFRRTALEMAKENEMLRQEVARKERYQTLASLTSGIVDEMRNPLTSLKGYAYFFKQKFDDREFLKKFSDILDKELAKINELIEHMTDYSNPAPLSAKETNMAKLLNETIGMLKSNLNEAKVTLETRYHADEKVHLHIDPSQLRQALTNVVLNAAEAMPDGGYLRVGTEQTDYHYIVTIADTGKGIAQERLSKVFDPFFSTKPNHTGLGLSIVQAVVEKHGGEIKVNSKEGAGTEFVIELPLDPLPQMLRE